MNRTYLGRVIGGLVIVAGLILGLFAQSANAQVAMSDPGSQIQSGVASRDSAKGGTSSQASSSQVGAYACGWHRPVYWHCGGNQFALVRVDFAWSWDETDIWVTRGGTDLERRFGRAISNAWCIQNC